MYIPRPLYALILPPGLILYPTAKDNYENSLIFKNKLGNSHAASTCQHHLVCLVNSLPVTNFIAHMTSNSCLGKIINCSMPLIYATTLEWRDLPVLSLEW